MADKNKVIDLDAATNLLTSGFMTAVRQGITASQMPNDLTQELSRRTRLEPMNALQIQLPGVPMLPPPDMSRLVIADSANYEETVRFAGNVQLVCLSSFTTGLYFISFAGRCQLPLVRQSTDNPIDMIAAPSGLMFYTKGLNSISVGIVNSGDVVSVMGWIQF